MRKKIVFAFLGVFLFLLGCACNQLHDSSLPPENSGKLVDIQDNLMSPEETVLMQDNESTPTQNNESPPTEETGIFFLDQSLDLNRYLVAINHPIERDYLNEQYECTCEAEQVALYEKYKELWISEANTYDTLIQDELLESGILLQEEYKDYIDSIDIAISQELHFLNKLQQELHSGGTIIVGNSAKCEMVLYRAKALKLILVYDELMVGRGWSWRNQSAG